MKRRARVIEDCARRVDDQHKLSTRFSDLADLLIECDYGRAGRTRTRYGKTCRTSH